MFKECELFTLIVTTLLITLLVVPEIQQRSSFEDLANRARDN